VSPAEPDSPRVGVTAGVASGLPVELVGSAPAFLALLKRLPALAAADHTILLSGETGTGKRLIARTLHSLSGRAAAPFVPLDCGALPEGLFELELLGHERGTSSQASERPAGLVSRAHRGTLFLDEVDSLSAREQIALLHALQDGTFRPPGIDAGRNADVRVIAAATMPLERLVEEGRFRADLYFRLNVLPLALPPLRQRREDILPLARYFMQRHGHRSGYYRSLSPAAAAALIAYGWPGNVRELENAVIRAMHLADGDRIEPADLGLPESPMDALSDNPRTGARKTFNHLKRDAITAFERDYLRDLMARHKGNVTHAARAAGKERRALGKLLRKHQISPRDFVGP
jgi:DNA-binding NtrC family response regulator